jgi:hypothetical protein
MCRAGYHPKFVLAAVFLAASSVLANAQPLGVFRWQMQPFCNVLSLTVVQTGASYTLAGTDDLCGAAQAAPATGTAALNPDGTIALGLVLVTPGGPAAHVHANVTLPSVSGTWRDADGNTGPFLFNGPGGGGPRPSPRTAAVITSAQLAASIFAGSGSATTIARSDHLHDDRYFTQGQTAALVAAAGEAITGSGVGQPATLAAQGSFFFINETITTTTPGQLLVSKYAEVTLGCSSGARWYYLLVDGVPVRSSLFLRGSASPGLAGQITGTTAEVVPAGTHTIGVGGQCFTSGNYIGGNVTVLATSSSVTVIP